MEPAVNMKMSKINLLLILASVVFNLMLAPVILASTATDVLEGVNNTAQQAGVSKGPAADKPTQNLATIIGRIINYLFASVAVVFLTVILIGGVFWMESNGKEEQIQKAKTFILNGIFGLMVIFIAYALVFVIFNSLEFSTNGA
ncbi:MAG: hypothetical protein PHW95_01945 [Patescibacteria group bacterium]|nr:hypothetical protein [Patescibacteria group bacterium]